jgi:hypothetical protein
LFNECVSKYPKILYAEGRGLVGNCGAEVAALKEEESVEIEETAAGPVVAAAAVLFSKSNERAETFVEFCKQEYKGIERFKF